MPMNDDKRQAKTTIEVAAGMIRLKVGGTWNLTEPFPRLEEIMPKAADRPEVQVIPFDLKQWDSSLPLFLLRVRAWCDRRGARLDLGALPDNLKRLFELIAASEKESAAQPGRPPAPHPVARALRRLLFGWKDPARFIGECVLAATETPAAPRHVHWKAFFSEMADAGPRALPIIGLLSFLVGLTFAFESSSQLQKFGLQIYVISGVGKAVLQQIGPLIAAVLLAGRTGAAFAAHIANMKLSGEIDALETVGVSPVAFLVLPRLAALVLIMPLAVLYSDLFGVLGSLTIVAGKLDIPSVEFWIQLQQSVTLTDVGVGLMKSVVFAIVIGLAGTLRGLQSERSSLGVGHAVTSAAVTGIAAVIVADALFSPILHRFGL